MASTDLQKDILDKVFRNNAFANTAPPANECSLHTSDPGDTGANEVTGGSYARQNISWNAPADDTAGTSTLIDNSNELNFSDMPNVTVTHVGIWDDPTAGNFMWGGALDNSRDLNSGDTLRIEAGDLDAKMTK